MFVPTKAFLTKGVGRHKEKLTSFEMALRDAHLATYNLVRVSSIFPPQCELLDREEGMSMLRPGQVLFTVVAESSTNEPARLVGRRLGHDGEQHLAGPQHAHPFLAVEQLALRREDRAHPHQVVRRQVGVPQRHLEAGELLLMPADALREEGLRRHEHFCVDQPVTSSALKGGTTDTTHRGRPLPAAPCRPCGRRWPA